jgi:exonuclease III
MEPDQAENVEEKKRIIKIVNENDLGVVIKKYFGGLSSKIFFPLSLSFLSIAGDFMRLKSWNILAETNFKGKEDMFPYYRPYPPLKTRTEFFIETLKKDWSHVTCLQEVSGKSHFEEIKKGLNYKNGAYSYSGKKEGDGCCILTNYEIIKTVSNLTEKGGDKERPFVICELEVYKNPHYQVPQNLEKYFERIIVASTHYPSAKRDSYARVKHSEYLNRKIQELKQMRMIRVFILGDFNTTRNDKLAPLILMESKYKGIEREKPFSIEPAYTSIIYNKSTERPEGRFLDYILFDGSFDDSFDDSFGDSFKFSRSSNFYVGGMREEIPSKDFHSDHVPVFLEIEYGFTGH